jgi:hypothetical protein
LITRNFEITIRIPEQNYIPTLFQVVENDNDVYNLTIHITDGINEIDYSQVSSATITFLKGDGNVVQGNLTVGENSLTYTMGTNEIAHPGNVLASIQLIGASGERLTTARFRFNVVKDLITPSAVQSTTEFSALVKAIAMMDELEDRLEGFPNIKVLGTYPTLAGLLAAHPDGSGLDGGYFVTSNGEFYIWSNVTGQWESLGTIKGPQGDQGPQGEPGPKGDKPAHQWSGTSLRFENPDGSWGAYVNLKGQDGTGAGDMLKSTYDTNDDGKVDAADNADKLGNIAANLYALKSYVDTVVATNIGTKISKVSSPTAGNIPVLTVNGEIEDSGKAPSDFMQRNISQTMTADLIAKSGTDYTARRVRNIILSDQDADPDLMQNGDIWIKYTDEE